MLIKTITEEYRTLQKKLHENPDYGIASLHFAPLVSKIIKNLNVESLSDYGAGKKNLSKGLTKLGIELKVYHPYDPAFPEYGEPKTADLVCCIDVLEHIEESFIENVISELRSITDKLAYFTIALKPAGKILKDGRNAHILLKPEDWWLNLIKSKFNFKEINKHPKRLKLLLC